MARDISFIQYMRAHGNTPVPTERPLLTGAIGGFIAGIPYAGLLHMSNALESVAENFGADYAFALATALLLGILGGMTYAFIFKRAANDTRGGWLFGMSYGFLLWVLGPTALWQTLSGRPVAVGTAAMGMFGAKIVYGLVLGLVFPWIHFLFRARLADASIDYKREKAETYAER